MGGIDLVALPAFQRRLLLLEGNVTRFLQREFGETVTAVKLAVCVEPAAGYDATLQCSGAIMARKVLLRGATSGTPYLYAEARLAMERLPVALATDLLETDAPLGRLLHHYHLNTSREVLETGIVREPSIASWFGRHVHIDLLWRRYRMHVDDGPLALIREWFPSTIPAAPST